MLDNSRYISGEQPEHIEWVYTTAIPKLEAMGVKIDVVASNKDYISCFNHVNTKGKYVGMKSGYPIGGKCVINSTCKLKPIKEYYKQFNDFEIVEYIGIAKDEPKRLARMKKNQISLLEKYEYTEAMALELCKEYELLSPLYKNGTRGGCWFCPNSKFVTLKNIYENHPHLWKELQKLDEIPNICCKGFKYGTTLKEVENKIKKLQEKQ